MCPETIHTGEGSENTRKVLWGITSFGTRRKNDTIGIYVKVIDEMAWIRDVIYKDKEQKLECHKNRVFCAAQKPIEVMTSTTSTTTTTTSTTTTTINTTKSSKGKPQGFHWFHIKIRHYTE